MGVWTDMTKRHRAERRRLVEDLAEKRITQAVAAKRLGVSPSCLNNFIIREGIFWPVKRQGRSSEK